MAWERLAHVALSGAGDTLDSGTFTAKKSLRVIVYIVPSGNTRTTFRFNSDSGSNYALRKSEDGGAENATSSQTSIKAGNGDNNHNAYHVLEITNISDKEKLIINHNMKSGGSGAGNAPKRVEAVAKWANTSAQITSIQAINDQGGSYGAGSYITVLGAKEAATADTITVDSLEAKKHLVVQAKLIASGSIEAAVRFNNDSGNNYSTRYGVNGSESTGTSKSSIDTNLSAGGNEFVTYNVINEATKEKLVISELVDSNTSGAGTAPQRVEVVGKWANTSNAITRVDLVNVGSGDFAEGTEVTVYGTD